MVCDVVSKQKKKKRGRAIITITERDDGKFDANLLFEPSIKNDPHAGQRSYVQATWICWNRLKEQLKGHIILTDE